jgi:putative methionine-R-sulfoxide reductase with GAF domain
MVDQLTGYYYSLEEKVDSRTQQLRLAAEIAQEASKGLTQGDVLRQASIAIAEKLDIPYHAIYLIDSVSKTASLLEQNSTLTDPLPEKNSVIAINNESMVGWSALNKKPRTSGDIRSEKEFPNTQGVLSSTASQITLPVIVEDDIAAILDFQSNQPNIFDNESLTVYSTLSDQLATGIRNIQAVETATVGLRETNALYTTSRQVTVANSIEEVTEHLAFLFSQTQYVSFFFSVMGEQIHLINVTDPKGTRLDQSLKGFNIPLEKGLSG